MPGITMKINRADLEEICGFLLKNLSDKKKALRTIGAVLRESIRTNFAEGGRPTKWAAVKGRQGQPLRDTNRLMNSITSKVTENSVRVGTNVVYAGVHHFGAKKHSFGTRTFQVGPYERTINDERSKRHGQKTLVWPHSRTVKLPWGTIPARPFVMQQPEDIQEIKEILAQHIIKGE